MRAAALDAAGNRDGFACELAHPSGEVEHVGSPYNVIENRIPLQPAPGYAVGTDRNRESHEA